MKTFKRRRDIIWVASQYYRIHFSLAIRLYMFLWFWRHGKFLAGESLGPSYNSSPSLSYQGTHTFRRSFLNSSMNSIKDDHVPGCGYCSTIVHQSTSHSFHLVTFAQSKCRWSILLDHQPTQEMAPSLHVLILRISRILESTWRLQHAMLIFRIRRKKRFWRIYCQRCPLTRRYEAGSCSLYRGLEHARENACGRLKWVNDDAPNDMQQISDCNKEYECNYFYTLHRSSWKWAAPNDVQYHMRMLHRGLSPRYFPPIRPYRDGIVLVCTSGSIIPSHLSMKTLKRGRHMIAFSLLLFKYRIMSHLRWAVSIGRCGFCVQETDRRDEEFVTFWTMVSHRFTTDQRTSGKWLNFCSEHSQISFPIRNCWYPRDWRWIPGLERCTREVKTSDYDSARMYHISGLRPRSDIAAARIVW